MKIRITVTLLFGLALASGQSTDNKLLSGKYWMRHLQLTFDTSGTITAAKSFNGSATFDGNGALSFSGQQVTGTAGAVPLTGGGTYSVQSNGQVSLTNPQQTGAAVNARLGKGALLGSSTEAANTFDLMIALPTSTAAPNLAGNYYVSSLDFVGGSTSQVHNAFFPMTGSGQTFGNVSLLGQGANLGAQSMTQQVGPVSFNITADGSGTLNFPLQSGSSAANQLVSGSKALYAAPDGSFFIAGAGQDFIVGVGAAQGAPTNANLVNLYATAGLRYQTDMNSYVGNANSAGTGKLVSSERVRLLTGPLDFTSASNYSVNADGSVRSPELNSLGLGRNGDSYAGSGAANLATGVYELFFGVRAAAPAAGTGPYIQPQAVVNAASFAPTGNPISPGELITVFGSKLSNTSTSASSPPFPTSLGGVRLLINGNAAPVYAVADGQVSGLVPFGTPTGSATITIDNNGTRSNAVTVAVAKTSPGIFTVPSAGFGPGAVLHADFTLVTPGKPAHRGEIVLVFLTGLGLVNPTFPDGSAAPGNPLSTAVSAVNVFVGGQSAAIAYSGAAPTLAGLYQLNITIPTASPTGSAISLAVETPEAFHDQVDIPIAP